MSFILASVQVERKAKLKRKLALLIKQRKIDLVREGFNPAGISDPVFWLDPATNAYERLTVGRYADIADGRVKL